MTPPRFGFSFIPLPYDVLEPPFPTRGEFMLICYLFKHGVRFGRNVIALTDDEILHGKRDQQGTRQDAGCGIDSRNTLKSAREELVRRKWIAIKRVSTDSRDGFMYSVKLAHFEDVVSEIDTTNQVSKDDTQMSLTDTSVSKNDTYNKEVDTKRSKNIKPSRADRTGDKRHSGFVTLWGKAWAVAFPDKATAGDVAPFTPRCAKALAEFLAPRNSWTDEDSRIALWNLIKSDNTAKLQPVWKWVSGLDLYRQTQCDKFNQPLQRKPRSVGVYDPVASKAKDDEIHRQIEEQINAKMTDCPNAMRTNITSQEWYELTKRVKTAKSIQSSALALTVPAFTNYSILYVYCSPAAFMYARETHDPLLTEVHSAMKTIKQIVFFEGTV